MVINGKQQAYEIDGAIYHCGTVVTMAFIGGKWKCVILWYLRNETMRFSALKKLIPDITDKMLSLQLKSLEADKLIHRKVTGKKPPLKVEYSLTELGRSLLPILQEITKWGINHGEKAGKLVEY